MENYIGFNTVEKLEVYNLYQLDDFGIYSINTNLFDSLNPYQKEDYPSFVYQENVMEVFEDFQSLSQSIQSDHSALAKYISSCTDSSMSFLLESYLQSPINEEGFRSIPFNKIQSDKKKILLLGDSFVYGLSASPTYYSFADLLLAKGYIVYNTGINGTDPAQYAAILEKYLARLQPDLVLLNFSSASDFMTFPREAKAFKPHEHQTNAGFIESAPLGSFLNAQESYNFYEDFVSIPKSSLAYFLCKHSSALSFLYGLLVDAELVYHPQRSAYFKARKGISDADMAFNTKVPIDKMNALAREFKVPFLNVIIPVKPESRISDKNYNANFVDEESLNISFSSYKYHYPLNLELGDYEKEGVHFNNKGSEKYANYLEELIIQTLKD